MNAMRVKELPSIEEAKRRMEEYIRKNPITKEHLAMWAEAEEKARCEKCGRVIFCGDLDKMCDDTDCDLKNRTQL